MNYILYHADGFENHGRLSSWMKKHGMSGVNPQGCQVFSFKQPGAEELEHDFI